MMRPRAATPPPDEADLPRFRAADRRAAGEDRRAALRARGLGGRHLRRDHAAARRRASSSPRTSTASCRRGRSRRSRAIRSGRTRSTTSPACSPTSASCTATARYADDPAIVGGLARFNGAAVHGDRPPEGPRHQGKDPPQLRHAAARGLPQGAAADEARREVRPAAVHVRRHAGRVSRASAPRSAASRRRSAATCTRWPGLRMPIIVTVIGEGGSGGALAIAVGDVTLMLQYATYSVISPEGCASILWKSAEHARGGGRNARHHRAAPEAARPHRQGRQRAARRRAPRSRGDDGRR